MIKVKQLRNLQIDDIFIDEENKFEGKVCAVNSKDYTFSILINNSISKGNKLNYNFKQVAGNPELIIPWINIIKKQNQLEFNF